jgi:hypothetical protein
VAREDRFANRETMTAADALSPTERDDLRRRFEARLARTSPLTDGVFGQGDAGRPPIAVTGALYFLFGRPAETIPAGLFDDPAVMLADQERRLYHHLCTVDDDFVPYVMPWFGTVVAASAFGCRVGFPPGQDPAVDPSWYPVQTVDDIDRLRVPDPERDGLMPTVLRYLRHMKANSVLPVGITDFQGPLTTANQLMGYDKLIYLMYDEPEAAHRLMDAVTSGLIRWVRHQKEVLGEPDGYCVGDQQVHIGPHGGVWFSDDDAVLVNADLYREFVVPYNSRILTEFGGGFVHYCGNATHHADNFLATEGLRGLNVFALHNIASVQALQEKVAGRLAILLCDFTPLDYGSYIDQVAASLDWRGLAILSEYSPIVAMLPSGRYEPIDRSLDGPQAVHARFARAFSATHGRGE